jgi:hypothetical protein
MSLSLAQEKLHYNAGQLELLSQQIRDGDLTPILKIYEDGIKNPWKSAFVGSLLRSAFIQIQKAKVGSKSGCTEFLKHTLYTGGYRSSIGRNRQITQVSRVDFCIRRCRASFWRRVYRLERHPKWLVYHEK